MARGAGFISLARGLQHDRAAVYTAKRLGDYPKVVSAKRRYRRPGENRRDGRLEAGDPG
jgi:hypothetical protein